MLGRWGGLQEPSPAGGGRIGVGGGGQPWEGVDLVWGPAEAEACMHGKGGSGGPHPISLISSSRLKRGGVAKINEVLVG